MELTLKPTAQSDIASFKRLGNKTIKDKITKLFEELKEHPENGTGKPEKLKYDLSTYWSRRINGEHRIIYKIDYDNNEVIIYSLKGHY